MRPVLLVTLIYLGILVAVLAVGLIMIAWRLSATAKALGQIRDSLLKVKSDTAPLNETIQGINGALTQLGGGLRAVLQELIRADKALGRIARKGGKNAA